MAKLQQRENVLKEILATERDYVSDLNVLIQVFKYTLEDMGFITEAQSQTLFSSIEELEALNKNQVLANFEDRFRQAEQNRMPLHSIALGDAFQSLAAALKTYRVYCANQPKALAFTQHLRMLQGWEALEQQFRDNPRVRGLALSDYIIKPVQRLCKYPLLLRELISCTDPNTPDYRQLQNAVDQVQEAVMYVNKMQAEAEKADAQLYELCVSLQSTIEGAEELYTNKNLRLTRQGTLQMLDKKKLSSRYVALFNEYALLCKPKKKPKKIGNYLKTYTLEWVFWMSVTNATDLADFKSDNISITNAFQLVDRKTNYQVTLCCDSVQAKLSWVAEFKEYAKAYQMSAARRELHATTTGTPTSRGSGGMSPSNKAVLDATTARRAFGSDQLQFGGGPPPLGSPPPPGDLPPMASPRPETLSTRGPSISLNSSGYGTMRRPPQNFSSNEASQPSYYGSLGPPPSDLPAPAPSGGSSGNWKVDYQRQPEELSLKIEALIRSCARNDPAQVGYYVFKEEVDANGCNYDGRTPLHLACSEGHLKIVQFLVIKANVNPNVTDRWGNTPVDEARKGGFAEIVTYLQSLEKAASSGAARWEVGASHLEEEEELVPPSSPTRPPPTLGRAATVNTPSAALLAARNSGGNGPPTAAAGVTNPNIFISPRSGSSPSPYSSGGAPRGAPPPNSHPQMGSPPPPSSTPVPPPSSVWKSAISADGKTYYYNTITNETTWDKPPEMDAPASPSKPPLRHAVTVGAGTASSGPSLRNSAPGAPTASTGNGWGTPPSNSPLSYGGPPGRGSNPPPGQAPLSPGPGGAGRMAPPTAMRGRGGPPPPSGGPPPFGGPPPMGNPPPQYGAYGGPPPPSFAAPPPMPSSPPPPFY